jgi:hypothetical protein
MASKGAPRALLGTGGEGGPSFGPRSDATGSPGDGSPRYSRGG